MKKQTIQGYIFVVLSAVIFGLMPLMAKFIYAEGVTPLSLVLIRNCFAVVIIFFFTKMSGVSLKVPLRIIPQIAVIGLMGSCVTSFLLYCSYNYIPSGAATVLHFIYPAVVVLGEIVFFKSGVKKTHIISVIMCIAGIAMFYNPESSLNLTGSVLAISSGITYSIYILALSSFKHKHIPALIFNLYSSVATTVVMFPLCAFTDNLAFPVTFTGWGLALLFAFALGFGAVVLFQKGTFMIGGSRASVLSTFEPITSIVAGVIIFGEPFSVFTVIGSVLVIVAGVIIAKSDK